jgi:signal transduction histidine kinase
MIVDNYPEWEGAHPDFKDHPLGAVVAVPIHWGDEFLGVVDAACERVAAFSEQDVHLLNLFADQAAVAIQNARLFAELEASNRELDAFSHTIAHDLKGPLANIIGFGSLLEDELRDGPEETVYLIKAILTAAYKMTDMIDQLLLLALLRDASTTVEPVMITLAVETAVGRYNPQIVARGITVEVAPGLPPALGHEQWITEVFANLISNAIKYIGKKNPAPRIAIRGRREGTCVRYEIEDNGLGIDPEDQSRLFEMFERFHKTETSGLGLGLSIARRIVTNLGGEIGAESVPGQGSTFWFTLPAAKGKDGTA